jgi:hypothetical protein
MRAAGADRSPRDNQNMTRREWLGVTGLACRNLWGAGDFWNRKPAAEWTSAEIVQLLSASPWARTMNIAVPNTGIAEGAANPANQNGQRDPTSAPAGATSVPLEKRRSGPGRGHVIVRWESAAPLREAMRTRLPAEFADHYVISVEGIDPAMLARPNLKEGPPADMPLEEQSARLKEGALLELRGKDPLPAGIVNSTGRFDKVWQFGFSRELLPVTAADRDLAFSIKAGAVRFRADFILKEMKYKGVLAL